MKREDKDKIAEALGASRVVDLEQESLSGPLDLLALREEFNQRLRSTGGRPTDPSWTVSRQVPFKEGSWERLQDLASEVGAAGRRVGPAQVAALLIENSLDEFEEEHWLQVLDESRAVPLLSEPDAAEAARVTYNQFDDWVQEGWLRPAGRQGRQLQFSADEVIRAHWLHSIANSPVDFNDLAGQVRDAQLSERYLVLTNAQTVSTVATRSRLYRLLETAGSHLVIDQLPERRKLLGLPPFPGDADDEEATRRAG